MDREPPAPEPDSRAMRHAVPAALALGVLAFCLAFSAVVVEADGRALWRYYPVARQWAYGPRPAPAPPEHWAQRAEEERERLPVAWANQPPAASPGGSGVPPLRADESSAAPPVEPSPDELARREREIERRLRPERFATLQMDWYGRGFFALLAALAATALVLVVRLSAQAARRRWWSETLLVLLLTAGAFGAASASPRWLARLDGLWTTGDAADFGLRIADFGLEATASDGRPQSAIRDPHFAPPTPNLPLKGGGGPITAAASSDTGAFTGRRPLLGAALALGALAALFGTRLRGRWRAATIAGATTAAVGLAAAAASTGWAQHAVPGRSADALDWSDPHAWVPAATTLAVTALWAALVALIIHRQESEHAWAKILTSLVAVAVLVTLALFALICVRVALDATGGTL